MFSPKTYSMLGERNYSVGVFRSVVLASGFRSWQGLHNACQLLSSHIRCGSPRWGMIWSTTVAVVNCLCAKHFTHSGCFRRYALLSRCHLLPYPRLAADGRSGCRGLCSSQYAPSVSFGQPGCLHGFSAFFGITGISFGHNKSRCGYPQRLCTSSSIVIIAHITRAFK